MSLHSKRIFASAALTAAGFVAGLTPPAHAQPCGSWSHLARGGPPPSTWGDMAYDSFRDRIVLFGGTRTNAFNSGLGDTWEWDGETWTLVATVGPERRFGHAMVYDIARRRVVLFGGRAPSGQMGDTWEWDGVSWTLVSTTGPSARFDPAMAFDSTRGRTVLFGGSHQANGGGLGDTWEWDGTSWLQVAAVGPPARVRHAMAFDKTRSSTVLFGGSHAPNMSLSNDTWEWDGTVWHEILAAGPVPRRSHMMAGIPTSGHVVLIGGIDNNRNRFDDTWVFDGADWVFLGRGPDALSQSSVAANPSTGSVLMFGGHNNSVYTENLFERSGSASIPTILSHPVSKSIVLGEPVGFEVIGGGGAGTAYQWRRDGVALRDDGRINGSTTPALQLLFTLPPDSGVYDVVISNGCGVVTSAGATLTFLCYPDCDQSTGVGVLDIFDFLCFQNSFVSGEPYACECDPNPACDISDFLCFQTAFVGGCP